MTQQLRGVIESVALERTKSFSVSEIEFKFILVKKSFYTGFILEDNFFIAIPEKALADAVYLSSMGRYNAAQPVGERVSFAVALQTAQWLLN